MGLERWPVLRPGDRIVYDGDEHQVTGIAGTSVRLRSATGTEQVVLGSVLTSAPDFEVVGAEPGPSLAESGLLDGLPEKAVAAARNWERHVVEVETGLPPGAAPGSVPRPEYDPQRRNLTERTEAKAAELGVTPRTIEDKRARYAGEGVLGLVDGRAKRSWSATGRADERLVAVIVELLDAETAVSTGTRSRLIGRVVKEVEARYGKDTVPLPSRSVFYEVVNVLAAGRHTFGSAVTRRQTANRPEGMFTPTFAARPGEQVQIDSTPIDVMVVLDSGQPVRAELTIAVDVATRTIGAALLRPIGTKAVDAAHLLARMLVPEPMRPGWEAALRMGGSRLPHTRLADVDARMAQAAAKPVIVPDTIVIDGGKVFLSETFTRACERLGISIQRARPRTPTDKGIVEATFGAVNTLFCQHVAGYTGPNVVRRGDRIEAAAVWTVAELQDLLDEWVICWQERPHDALRDPHRPGRPMSPNEKYASLVATCGYLPLALPGEDYLELLPVAWRRINDWGIRIDNRTYNSPHLGPWRRQRSGNTAHRGQWEIRFDPYDVSRVFLRAKGGWITVPWIHQPLVNAPFADFTWQHARLLAEQSGQDPAREDAVARILRDLLLRAADGHEDQRTARVLGRDRASTPIPFQPPGPAESATPPPAPVPSDTNDLFEVFDAHAEAEKWL